MSYLPMYGYAWKNDGRIGVELFSVLHDRDRTMAEARDDWGCEVVRIYSTLDLDPATLFPPTPIFESGPVEIEATP
jgi:hypothetical protein